jgi:hypothetical protein
LCAGALGIDGRAQSSSSYCSADSSPHDENGRPHCCPDGSMPEGVNQCWCEPNIVHLREYRNPQHEYEVQVPDGVAEILGCSGVGAGFRISLTHPDTGKEEGDSSWNTIWVSGSERTGGTLQEIADQWAQQQRVDGERDHSTDIQIDPAVQTSLSSLPAIELKARRTRRDGEKLIYEAVDVKTHGKYVYSFLMVTPVEQYDKNEKLFQSIVDGFRYVPSKHGRSQ